MASIFRRLIGAEDALVLEVEALQRDFVVAREYGEELLGKNKGLRKENDRLREECKRVKAETRSPPSSAVQCRSIGVQVLLCLR